MAEETARLTLAFVGEQEVHRNNSRALLEDFVDGWQKQHRKGEVRVLLPPEDVGGTDTISDLDDWASTSGYDVSYVSLSSIVTELLAESDARLILVGDPNDDEDLYDVAEEAAMYRIQTRSLINGLEKVVFDDDDFEDDMAGLHEVDVETGEGWADEENLTDEAAKLLEAVPDVEDAPEADAPPDLDMLATLADDGEVEAQEEIKTIAAAVDIDTAPFETWADAVEAIRGKDSSQTEVAPDYVPDPPEEEAAIELTGEDLQDTMDERGEGPLDPPEDVPPSEELRDELGIQAPYTRDQLEAMEFDEVKAIGVEVGLVPGRGYKKTVYINKILQLTGVETDKPKRKRSRGKAKLEVAPPAASEIEAILAPYQPPEGDAAAPGATITPLLPPNPITVEKAVIAEHVRMLRGMADELELLYLKD